MGWSRAAILGVIGLVAALMFPMPKAAGPSYDFHDESCPTLRQMVHDSVEEALKEDIGIAAGLLRIMFHDCFPQGCDASLLVHGRYWSETSWPQNKGIRPTAMALIDTIRAKVQNPDACGPTVSCTDIMNLATREAVMHFNVPGYAVPLGLKDSLAPADLARIWELPGPDLSAAELLQRFATRGFDVADVVVLSGAHTIGRSSCSGFQDRFQESTSFARRLRANCSSDANRLQDLDVTTPDKFDNEYYHNLLAGKGVLTSDLQLLRNHTTRWWVNNFAQDQGWFFAQFGTSMSKMAHLPSSEAAQYGEIRNYSCFWSNQRWLTASA
ncbi:hypothetical protein QYE76_034594 [Lolium multiflorum]|uniref:Peroxidase n=1 Tax=Lolium multiflorum TaxID=4521 RepID=A0AAD8QY15_LOLMU|nr:hypothetical protein QYE76_034594 [Lolium multiflorum]